MKRKKRDWAAIIQEQEERGVSIKDYCKAEGIHPTSFYKNRKVFPPQPLVEIPVPAAIQTNPIVIRTGHYALTVQSGFDRDSLKLVLQVIGEIE